MPGNNNASGQRGTGAGEGIGHVASRDAVIIDGGGEGGREGGERERERE